MNTDKISKFIIKKRKEKKLTQQELADLTHLSEKTISKWECGRGIPDIGNLQSLSKALDVSVTELLNGEEEQKEKPVIDYIEYKEKKNKKRIILFSLIFILILAIVSLLFFLLNNINTVKMYKLSGESDHFVYGTAIVLDSNMKDMLVEGNIEVKDSYIEEKQIKYIAYYCDGDLIVGGGYDKLSGGTNKYYMQNDGYNEYFSEKKLNNIDKWYIVIQYDYNNEQKEEKIELKAEEVMKNNKLFYKKTESIGKGEKPEVTEEEIYERYEKEVNEIKTYLTNHDFKEKSKENFIKKVKEGTFYIYVSINRRASDFNFEDEEYQVMFKPYSQTYIFLNKKNSKLGLDYIRSTNKYTCSISGDNYESNIIECPEGTDKKIEYYLSIIDKEFEDMYPQKESWSK